MEEPALVPDSFGDTQADYSRKGDDYDVDDSGYLRVEPSPNWNRNKWGHDYATDHSNNRNGAESSGDDMNSESLEGEGGSKASGRRIGAGTGMELSAGIPLVLGVSVLLLFSVLLTVRCYSWYRYGYSSYPHPSLAGIGDSRRKLLKKLFRDHNDYLVDGMYL